MATHETYKNGAVVERWTNEGVLPGYYSGNPLIKQRDLTAEEAQRLADADAANAAANNGRTIREQAQAALDNNRTFLALTNPTNAQNAAQVKALTRQVNGIIRLVLGKLDGTD